MTSKYYYTLTTKSTLGDHDRQKALDGLVGSVEAEIIQLAWAEIKQLTAEVETKLPANWRLEAVNIHWVDPKDGTYETAKLRNANPSVGEPAWGITDGDPSWFREVVELDCVVPDDMFAIKTESWDKLAIGVSFDNETLETKPLYWSTRESRHLAVESDNWEDLQLAVQTIVSVAALSGYEISLIDLASDGDILGDLVYSPAAIANRSHTLTEALETLTSIYEYSKNVTTKMEAQGVSHWSELDGTGCVPRLVILSSIERMLSREERSLVENPMGITEAVNVRNQQRELIKIILQEMLSTYNTGVNFLMFTDELDLFSRSLEDKFGDVIVMGEEPSGSGRSALPGYQVAPAKGRGRCRLLHEHDTRIAQLFDLGPSVKVREKIEACVADAKKAILRTS